MLSAKQQETLRTAIDRIIPADDYPSGWEAGVGDYLTRQFEGDLRDAVALYQIGLDALDAEANAGHGAGFAALNIASQDALLARIEQGQVATVWPVDPADFFTMVVNHCMEGFYSDSGNGGNHNGIAWAMIGFEVTG